jgi:hypothetical protein
MAMTRTAATRPAAAGAPARAGTSAATRRAVRAAAARGGVGPAEPNARALVWGFEGLGWGQSEAGNVVALAYGLRPARDGWAVREIEHLRFLRSLVRAGRIAS